MQPRDGEELVVERIATADDDGERAALVLALGRGRVAADRALDGGVRGARPRGVRASTGRCSIFDQFEELVTLFDEAGARVTHSSGSSSCSSRCCADRCRSSSSSPSARTTSARSRSCSRRCPELVDQALRLAPPARRDAADDHPRARSSAIPDHFARELSPAARRPPGDRARGALRRRRSQPLGGADGLPAALAVATTRRPLLAEKGPQGLLEDYLGEALDAFPPELQARRDRAARPDGHVGGHAQRDLGGGPVRARPRGRGRAFAEACSSRRSSGSSAIEARAPRAPPRPRPLRDHERVPRPLDQPAPRRAPPFAGRRRERRRLIIPGAIAAASLLLAGVVAGLAIWASHSGIPRAKRRARQPRLPLRRTPRPARRPDSMCRCCSRWPHSRHIEPVPPAQRSLVAA